jgi:hypothetical protein
LLPGAATWTAKSSKESVAHHAACQWQALCQLAHVSRQVRSMLN